MEVKQNGPKEETMLQVSSLRIRTSVPKKCLCVPSEHINTIFWIFRSRLWNSAGQETIKFENVEDNHGSCSARRGTQELEAGCSGSCKNHSTNNERERTLDTIRGWGVVITHWHGRRRQDSFREVYDYFQELRDQFSVYYFHGRGCKFTHLNVPPGAHAHWFSAFYIKVRIPILVTSAVTKSSLAKFLDNQGLVCDHYLEQPAFHTFNAMEHRHSARIVDLPRLFYSTWSSV